MSTPENATCRHIVTQGRSGETGSWCCACGIKVYEVDARVCGDCAHHMRHWDGSTCRKHLMAVSRDMHVTYKIADGSCWTEKPNDA